MKLKINRWYRCRADHYLAHVVGFQDGIYEVDLYGPYINRISVFSYFRDGRFRRGTGHDADIIAELYPC